MDRANPFVEIGNKGGVNTVWERQIACPARNNPASDATLDSAFIPGSVVESKSGPRPMDTDEEDFSNGSQKKE